MATKLHLLDSGTDFLLEALPSSTRGGTRKVFYVQDGTCFSLHLSPPYDLQKIRERFLNGEMKFEDIKKKMETLIHPTPIELLAQGRTLIMGIFLLQYFVLHDANLSEYFLYRPAFKRPMDFLCVDAICIHVCHFVHLIKDGFRTRCQCGLEEYCELYEPLHPKEISRYISSFKY